jgi:hypothetical protein
MQRTEILCIEPLLSLPHDSVPYVREANVGTDPK